MSRSLRTIVTALLFAMAPAMAFSQASVALPPASAIDSSPAQQPQPQAMPPDAAQPAPIERVPAATQPTAQPDAQPPVTPDGEKAARKLADKKDKKNSEDNDQPIAAADIHNPVIWHDPGDIVHKDLLNGQGGEKRQPLPPFTFVDEDTSGTNPKFDIRDANGKKWRVKLGEEARPEVVASRLLWAVGYFVNDDYTLENAQVIDIHLKRGGDRITANNRLPDARFSRKPGGEDKIAIWEWKNNPFTGTREFNGLRVMMAVMNNWDLKDVNNSVYTDEKTGQQIFLVNDVGATFGTNGLSFTRARSKGNIDSFRGSKFIQKVIGTEVDFETPKAPKALLLESGGAAFKTYSKRASYDWIGNNIPRKDARWMGDLLGQLSHQQLVDAFRAGNFPSSEVEAYVELVEGRIAELKKL